MKTVDYIVVGLGIAGISFCEQLQRSNKSFVVYSDNQAGATAKSGGILNPTVLKFFTAVWKSSEFYPEAISFYRDLNTIISVSGEIPVYRILSTIHEQNNWTVATDKKRTKDFLSPVLLKNTNRSIKAPYGFGEVTAAIQIKVAKLLSDYRNFLDNRKQLLEESFDYSLLDVGEDGIQYENFKSKYIVFCEGISALKNPYFPSEKLYGNMGEYIIIHAPRLKSKAVLKGPFYVIPLGDDLYKVGATFNPGVLSEDFTEDGKVEILNGLEAMISCDYEIIDQTIGIRPASVDRNPLIGPLSGQKRMSFINGLGSRGFLMAPLLSKWVYRNLENGKPIPAELDINRTMENRIN